MKVTEQTKGIARAVLDYIAVYPERHDQSNWLAENGHELYADAVTPENICNTTMCAAGTAVFVSRTMAEFKKFDGEWETEGAALLGLDYIEADSLFYSNNENATNMLRALAEGDEHKFNEIAGGVDYEALI